MLAAVYKGQGLVTLDERPQPRPDRDELVIRVHAASICGTDLKIIRGGHFRVGPDETRVLGHELAGEIVEVGSNVGRWRVGQRVSVLRVGLVVAFAGVGAEPDRRDHEPGTRASVEVGLEVSFPAPGKSLCCGPAGAT